MNTTQITTTAPNGMKITLSAQTDPRIVAVYDDPILDKSIFVRSETAANAIRRELAAWGLDVSRYMIAVG